jgi:hypothetical protein
LGDLDGLYTVVEEELRKYLTDTKLISRTCLAVEEICTYTREKCGPDVPVDIMISADRDRTIITCRIPSKPFYPIKPDQENLTANELMLTKLFHIRHEYIFGLNSTSLCAGGGYEK